MKNMNSNNKENSVVKYQILKLSNKNQSECFKASYENTNK